LIYRIAQGGGDMELRLRKKVVVISLYGGLIGFECLKGREDVRRAVRIHTERGWDVIGFGPSTEFEKMFLADCLGYFRDIEFYYYCPDVKGRRCIEFRAARAKGSEAERVELIGRRGKRVYEVKGLSSPIVGAQIVGHCRPPGAGIYHLIKEIYTSTLVDLGSGSASTRVHYPRMVVVGARPLPSDSEYRPRYEYEEQIGAAAIGAEFLTTDEFGSRCYPKLTEGEKSLSFGMV
jgi:hypothetical protein